MSLSYGSWAKFGRLHDSAPWTAGWEKTSTHDPQPAPGRVAQTPISPRPTTTAEKKESRWLTAKVRPLRSNRIQGRRAKQVDNKGGRAAVLGSPKRKRGSRRICFNTFFGSPKMCLKSFSRATYYGDQTRVVCTVTYEISLLLYGATIEFEGHCILTPFSPPPIHVHTKNGQSLL